MAKLVGPTLLGPGPTCLWSLWVKYGEPAESEVDNATMEASLFEMFPNNPCLVSSCQFTGPVFDRSCKIRVRSGSVRGPCGLRLGFVRGSFRVRLGSVRGLFGVRSGSIRRPFGIRSESARGPFEWIRSHLKTRCETSAPARATR